MITAEEANNLAKKHDNSDKIVEDFLDMANAAIKDYAKKGRYSIELACIASKKGTIYARIKESLKSNGYDVTLNFPFIKIKW
jgi:hypothetical protein